MLTQHHEHKQVLSKIIKLTWLRAPQFMKSGFPVGS
jgi:hypothetical protein